MAFVYNAFDARVPKDRSTKIGGMINAYLQSETELDDRAIHLLFSANRWELACVFNTTSPIRL